MMTKDEAKELITELKAKTVAKAEAEAALRTAEAAFMVAFRAVSACVEKHDPKGTDAIARMVSDEARSIEAKFQKLALFIGGL